MILKAKALEVDTWNNGTSTWVWRNGKVQHYVPTKPSWKRIIELFGNNTDKVSFIAGAICFTTRISYE